MILPIYAYGHPVLKKVCEPIDAQYPELQQFVADMWETMYNSDGVGLAAPQVGKPVRIFMIDTTGMRKDKRNTSESPGIKKVFFNAVMLEETGEPFGFEEGCLSIPQIRGDVHRPPVIRLRYMDENFVEHEESFSGVDARVIQHEYDHIEGVLFVERLSSMKRRLLQRKLEAIRLGKIVADYKMRFFSLRKN